MVLLVGQTLLLPPSNLLGSSDPSSVLSVNLGEIASLGAMQTWLESLYAETSKAKEQNRFSFDLQERTLKKSGEAISRIVALEKNARLTNPKVSKAFRQAFEQNDKVLRFIIRANEEVIEELQEEKLDEVEDTQAFLDSAEWQMPHRLISLSRYWMSWSSYYRSFLYRKDDQERKVLLDDAIAGFSLTLFDIAEQTIVAKSLFGRALCFKETGNEERAAKDLEAITENVRQNDPLYMWSVYERARLSYSAGKHAEALGHLEKLDTGIEEKTVNDVLGSEHKRLREKVVLEPRAKALLEKVEGVQDKGGEQARRLCREALDVLKRLSRFDAAYATKLYHLVEQNAVFFSDLAYEELGAIGYLALADDHFRKGEFEEAAKRYRRLWASSDMYIRDRMDDVYFRSGYVYCQIGRWKDALASFDQLYKKFPHSKLLGKAVCLEYVAAAGNYKRSSNRSNYARYVTTSKKYLKKCPNPRDRDGAHYFLGKDYEKQKMRKEARREFSAVEKGSAHYWPARYYILKYDVEDLERRKEAGEGRGAGWKKRYQAMASQFDSFRRLPSREKGKPGIAEIVPYMTILQARMFRCASGNACGEALRVLEGFEERFRKDQGLWLTAMDLRLECLGDSGMMAQTQEQIAYLLEKYPVDQDLWEFLGEWAETYDREAKKAREAGKPDQVDPIVESALMLYTGMASIASENRAFENHLDVVQFRMAEILMARNEVEKAERAYLDVLKRTPDAADALSRLGSIYETQGRWDEALDVWRKFTKGIESGSHGWLDARYRIALAHSKMGRASEACEVITMIRVLHPDNGDESFRRNILSLEREVCKEGRQPR